DRGQLGEDGSEESRPDNPTETFGRHTLQNDRPKSQDKPEQRITRRVLAIWATWRRWLIVLVVLLVAGLCYRLFVRPSPTPVEPQPPVTSPTPVEPPPATQATLPSDPAQEFWTWVPEKITVASPSFADSVWAAFTLALLSLLSGAFLWWWYRHRSKL